MSFIIVSFVNSEPPIVKKKKHAPRLPTSGVVKLFSPPNYKIFFSTTMLACDITATKLHFDPNSAYEA